MYYPEIWIKGMRKTTINLSYNACQVFFSCSVLPYDVYRRFCVVFRCLSEFIFCLVVFCQQFSVLFCVALWCLSAFLSVDLCCLAFVIGFFSYSVLPCDVHQFLYVCVCFLVGFVTDSLCCSVLWYFSTLLCLVLYRLACCVVGWGTML
jgi:hypothetical protein